LKVIESVSTDDNGAQSTSYHYQFTVEFSPKLAVNAPERMVLTGFVSERFWNKLKRGQQINVLYAVEDPRIVLLEGES
jgi:hypothetical protein